MPEMEDLSLSDEVSEPKEVSVVPIRTYKVPPASKFSLDTPTTVEDAVRRYAEDAQAQGYGFMRDDPFQALVESASILPDLSDADLAPLMKQIYFADGWKYVGQIMETVIKTFHENLRDAESAAGDTDEDYRKIKIANKELQAVKRAFAMLGERVAELASKK